MKPSASASLTHIKNAPSSTPGMFAGNVTLSSSMQYANAICPMVFTLAGIVTLTNGGYIPNIGLEVCAANAAPPMRVTPAGTVTSASPPMYW